MRCCGQLQKRLLETGLVTKILAKARPSPIIRSSRSDPSLSSPSPLRDSFSVERLSVGRWRPPSRTCLGPQVHKPFKPCWQMPVGPERALSRRCSDLGR